MSALLRKRTEDSLSLYSVSCTVLRSDQMHGPLEEWHIARLDHNHNLDAALLPPPPAFEFHLH